MTLEVRWRSRRSQRSRRAPSDRDKAQLLLAVPTSEDIDGASLLGLRPTVLGFGVAANYNIINYKPDMGVKMMI
jgi:hypothetical protein